MPANPPASSARFVDVTHAAQLPARRRAGPGWALVGRRAAAAGRVARRRADAPKSIIMIHLERRAVAPRHVRHEAARRRREYRGEFNPIRTNVPGMRNLRADADAGEDRRQVRDPPRRASWRTCTRATSSTAAIPGRSRRGPPCPAKPGGRRSARSSAGCAGRLGHSAVRQPRQSARLGTGLLRRRRARAVPRRQRQRPRSARQHGPPAPT